EMPLRGRRKVDIATRRVARATARRRDGGRSNGREYEKRRSEETDRREPADHRELHVSTSAPTVGSPPRPSRPFEAAARAWSNACWRHAMTVDTKIAAMTSEEIVALSRAHTFFSWSVQGAVDPIAIDRAEGVYLYSPEGKRYLDFNSQLMSVNIGHGDRRVIDAITEQALKL